MRKRALVVLVIALSLGSCILAEPTREGLHWVLLTVLLVFLGYFRFLVDGLVLYGGETSSSPLFPPSMVGGFDPDDDRYT